MNNIKPNKNRNKKCTQLRPTYPTTMNRPMNKNKTNRIQKEVVLFLRIELEQRVLELESQIKMNEMCF